LNPADNGTRDNLPKELTSHNRWLVGPEFLKSNKQNWPMESKTSTLTSNEDLEVRRDFTLLTNDESNPGLPNPERFSSWSKLIRTTAWMLRFLTNCKSGSKQVGVLSVCELEQAELLWCQTVQKESYPQETKSLKANREIDKCSSIYTLNPQIDQHGLLRVNGRLRNAKTIPDFTKQPVILDSHHHYTRLLLNHFHLIANHNGMETVANEIRQRFWIPKLRMALRSVWSNCRFCSNKRAKPATPMMGDLPPARLNKNVRPFTSVGMDYFGPISIKFGKKIEKRYGVLFTCMSTRAINLELALSLSTDSCILAIRRMISRRGYPAEIFSDNGTNFRGAELELRKSLQDLDSSRIKSYLAEKRINRKFNPPACPHMGGV